jgi:MFS family permease
MSNRAVAIIIAGFLTLFASFAIRYGYGLLLPQMIPSLGISKTEAGIIYSSYFIAYTIFSPILGLLVDRSDARLLLTFFVALLGIGAYLMSFSFSVLYASLFFTLAGIGHSACWVPVVTVVQRWVSERRRGMVLAIVDLGSATGIAVWSILIPLIIGSYSWRAGWKSLGLLAFLVAGMNFFLVKSHPPVESSPQGPSAASPARIPIKVAYMAILRDRNFYLIGLSYMLLSFSILIPFAFLATYATQELLIPYKSATVLVAVIGVTGAIGKLVLGHISDIAGRIWVMMLCGVLTAAGGLGMAYVQGFSWLILFTAVFGIGYGTIWPVYAAAARDFFSKEYAGSVVGLWTLYHGIGSILSPLISGWTIDATGSYVWAFFLTVISGVMSVLLLIPILMAGSGSGMTARPCAQS